MDSKDKIITPESKAKAPVSEEQVKGPINKLVLSYLAHHGYVKTAQSFQKQCEGPLGSPDIPALPHPSLSSEPVDDHDIDMDAAPSRERGTFDSTDIKLRTQIVNSVIVGDIDAALMETEKHHPTVLEVEEGLMLFKLRCRKFVELILEAEEMKKKKKTEETIDECTIRGGEDGMDVDGDPGPLAGGSLRTAPNGFGNRNAPTAIQDHSQDQSISPGRGGWLPSGGVITQYESALNHAISYGQTLWHDYKADSRLEVRTIFRRTFGIVAWYDPMEAGGVAAEVAGHDARVVLANELNQAILSEGFLLSLSPVLIKSVI